MMTPKPSKDYESESQTVYIPVRMTYNYEMFNFFDSNRDLNKEHIKKLIASILNNDLTVYSPILVDKYLYVIDGQHRLQACKNLEKPVYFVVADDVKESDMITFNANSFNWKTTDYVKHYYKDNENFATLLGYQQSLDISLNNLLILAGVDSKEGLQAVKNGQITIGDDFHDLIEKYKLLTKHLTKAQKKRLDRRSFIRSVRMFFRCESVDWDRFVNVIKENIDDMKMYGQVKDQVCDIIHFYNKGKKGEIIVFIEYGINNYDLKSVEREDNKLTKTGKKR